MTETQRVKDYLKTAMQEDPFALFCNAYVENFNYFDRGAVDDDVQQFNRAGEVPEYVVRYLDKQPFVRFSLN